MPAGVRRQRSRPELCLEWIWFFVSLLPRILYAFYTRLIPVKNKNLDGKVVLVTGAAEGLGREMALVFAKEGCAVVCVDTNEQEVLETAAEIVRDGEKARAYIADLAKPEEARVLRESVRKDLGSVDVLVCCPSPEHVRRVDHTTEDAVRDILGLNLLAPVWLIREFLPEMKARDSGHIVVVSSASAHWPLANAALYAASQCAVAGFMESVRQEVLDQGCRGVHFTTVFPAFLKSSRNNKMFNFWQRVSSQHVEVVAVNALSAVKSNNPYLILPEYLYWLFSITRFLPTPVSDRFFNLFDFGKMVESEGSVDQPDSLTSSS